MHDMDLNALFKIVRDFLFLLETKASVDFNMLTDELLASEVLLVFCCSAPSAEQQKTS